MKDQRPGSTADGASRAIALLARTDALTRLARESLEAGDMDALVQAIDERDRVQRDLEPELAALVRAAASSRGAERAELDRLVASVRDHASALQELDASLLVALSAGRQSLRQEIEHLDATSARSGMYRTSRRTPGASLDLRR